MIIELNKYVEIEEVSELALSGVNIGSDCKVEFTFSKAALIGFATNLLWLYEDMDKKRQTHIHIDPLGGEIPGNQALGFFLTSKSPSLIVQVGERKTLDKIRKCKQIDIKNSRIICSPRREKRIPETPQSRINTMFLRLCPFLWLRYKNLF